MLVKSYIRDIVGYGGWLTAAVIIRNMTDEIDKIIIGRLLPISDLGALNRPQGFIARISTQVNSIVDTVLFPILSSIQEDKEKIARGYLKIVSLVVTFSSFLSFTILLGSKLVIDIFFGPQWKHLQPILVIFAFTMILNGYSRVSDSFFRSLGIVKQYFFARMINWLIVISCVIIGCRFGIMGAAVAIAVGSFASCIVKFFMQYRRIGVRISQFVREVFRSMVAPFAIALISAPVFLLSPYGYYLGVLIFVLLVIATILYMPHIYSSTFREIVISRYVNHILNRVNREY